MYQSEVTLRTDINFNVHIFQNTYTCTCTHHTQGISWCSTTLIFKSHWFWDFPGGAVVKNPPANAGDRGSSPGPGRSNMPWSNKAHVPQLLSLCSRACEPQLLSPCATTTEAHMPRAHAPQQEKPLQWEPHTPQRRVAPARLN